MRKKIASSRVIAGIAVVLLILSLSMPWYTQNSKYSMGDDTMESSYRVFPSLLPQQSSSEEETSNTTSTVIISSWMVTIGTISAALSVMVIGISAYPDRKNYKKIGALLLIIGIIFAVVAPIFMMTQFPDAYKNDRYGEDSELPDHDTPAKSFFGSRSEGENEMSWGAGLGWYISFIAAGFLAVALIVLLSAKEGYRPHPRSTRPPQRYEQRQPREQRPMQPEQPRQRQEAQSSRPRDYDRRY